MRGTNWHCPDEETVISVYEKLTTNMCSKENYKKFHLTSVGGSGAEKPGFPLSMILFRCYTHFIRSPD